MSVKLRTVGTPSLEAVKTVMTLGTWINKILEYLFVINISECREGKEYMMVWSFVGMEVIIGIVVRAG